MITQSLDRFYYYGVILILFFLWDTFCPLSQESLIYICVYVNNHNSQFQPILLGIIIQQIS